MKQLLKLILIPALVAGCDKKPEGASAPKAAEEPSATATNRIDVPAAVRKNLGITFAKVERRRVAATVRMPGRFELLPTARREYRAALPGFVQVLVSQYEDVPKGKPIFRMDSPEWHRLKNELHEAEVGIERATAELAVADRTKTEAEQITAALQKRIDDLAGAEVRRAELETELATRKASIPRLEAEIDVKKAALEESRHDLGINVAKAAAILGLTPAYLRETETTADGGHKSERWFGINQIGLAAREAGVVENIGVTDGAWVEANSLIATTVNPAALRFRAVGLQGDLGKLKDGLSATVVAPDATSQASVSGKLKIGLDGNADQRTIDLLVTPDTLAAWAKPGVSALLEIVTDDSATPEFAVPVSSIIRDELTSILFRRDPKDPDKVIRMEADLGISDGKWVVINSGLKAGDEVVLDGVYELKLAGGGKAGGGKPGGHFHADGTYHEAHGPEKE